MKPAFYTGVGSRQTPVQVLDLMVRIGRILGLKEWVLRSGAADGADAAFETGCDEVGGPKEIYLPWPDFNGNASSLAFPHRRAHSLAMVVHPAWARLGDSVKKLHARNVHQVLGRDLDSPSSMVLCWTDQGREKGGTATAIRIARIHKVPVWNLGLSEVFMKFSLWADAQERHGLVTLH